MIPLKDDAPRYSTPFVNYFLILANTFIFLFQLSLGPRVEEQFLTQFALIPAHITNYAHYAHGYAAFLPLLTSMFLHGGWSHLIFNMLFLWIFGDNVEDQLGHFRYLIFYLMAGVVAGCVHILFNFGSRIPTVGASGAIAGVMGAYFVLFPSARVLTLIPFFIPIVYLPAWVFLGYWFIVNFLISAATSMPGSHPTTTIAVWAHVGGFLAGVTYAKTAPVRMKRQRRALWDSE